MLQNSLGLSKALCVLAWKWLEGLGPTVSPRVWQSGKRDNSDPSEWSAVLIFGRLKSKILGVEAG